MDWIPSPDPPEPVAWGMATVDEKGNFLEKWLKTSPIAALAVWQELPNPKVCWTVFSDDSEKEGFLWV